MRKGINYLSRYYMYRQDYTPDSVLHRDFARFKADGLECVILLMLWSRIEEDTRGIYDNAFLDNIKRCIRIAREHGLQTIVSFHTLWNSPWLTPAYVIDPYEGENRMLAIVRDPDMRQAFLDMFTYAVQYLAGTPGIYNWTINEPWYWPKTLPPPLDGVDQKENFITLFQDLSDIVHTIDGRPFSCRFVCVHNEPPPMANIFDSDWNWDPRLFNAFDFITFNVYFNPDPALYEQWEAWVEYNIKRTHYDFRKRVEIGECGIKSDDDQVQASGWHDYLRLFDRLPVDRVCAFHWMGDSEDPNWHPFGVGYNLCAGEDGNPRPAYEVFVNGLQPPSGSIITAGTALGLVSGLLTTLAVGKLIQGK